MCQEVEPTFRWAGRLAERRPPVVTMPHSQPDDKMTVQDSGRGALLAHTSKKPLMQPCGLATADEAQTRMAATIRRRR